MMTTTKRVKIYLIDDTKGEEAVASVNTQAQADALKAVGFRECEYREYLKMLTRLKGLDKGGN